MFFDRSISVMNRIIYDTDDLLQVYFFLLLCLIKCHSSFNFLAEKFRKGGKVSPNCQIIK